MKAPNKAGLGAFSHVTIGVTRLDDALVFWGQNFGLEVRARREGPDTALAQLWGLAPERVVRQAIIATPLAAGRWATAGALCGA